MISLKSGKLSSKLCRQELDEFNRLLSSKSEIGETELLNFFKTRSQLILLMGRVVAIDAPEKYNDELPIIGKFRADFVVADKSQSSFAFIEFENAKENSIFNKVLNRKTSVYPWSARFEHGYSQVIDWYLHLAANDNSVNMQSEFGSFSIRYYGALIIGRDSYLAKSDCRERFARRVDKTLVDSKHISCYTFDELYEAMEEQYDIFQTFR
ncbi:MULTISPECIES: Shedu immune nuclease family protein [Vibrio harveyi group]|uniref:Shedu immune nuclease family protein n=1 Tax=Vibrio harveyi group TaxID=717610 RepID=UPI0011213A36|nr:MULTISPECIES: Shedu immune nuclease family protein [Vibrio harveyi group]MBS9994654.1 DUF4263 domain-containing protein [Vibrio alginolyticus]TOP83567.1 hypothetical protein CGH08_21350 [Vibrio parahaemolyticus]TOQ29763.1 hypothetical protein CGG99_09170 [Vibrio parahaemolyticus]